MHQFIAQAVLRFVSGEFGGAKLASGQIDEGQADSAVRARDVRVEAAPAVNAVMAVLRAIAARKLFSLASTREPWRWRYRE